MPRKKQEIKPIQAMRLKEARENANLTQQYLADQIHVSVQMVRNWENARRVIPDYVFDKYSELCKVHKGYLKGYTSLKDAQVWKEFDNLSSPLLADEIRQYGAFKDYVESLGFIVEDEFVSEDECNIVFTSPEGRVSRFNSDEANSLEHEVKAFVTFKITNK